MSKNTDITEQFVPRIRKLDEAVINRIAAGEVVQKPSSAIKELIENSLDAKATNIIVTVKGGGISLLQIQDNGQGIRKEDLRILCERFTTSKLQTFDDLKSVQTYGFRGEALSSITHVANVTITTKTEQSQCAYKTVYSDGRVKVEPKPIAGMTGTIITVEDLFHNMPTRRLAFKNASEQYAKILEVVMKYSIHHGDRGVAFTCKRIGQISPDYQTSSPTTCSAIDSIRLAYGQSLAKELVDLSDELDIPIKETNESNESYHRISIKGKISNASYSSKKNVLILFINNRLVESTAIRKVCDNIYSSILPKQSHPFAYLSIDMPPHLVDVNIHPTKKEVRFLYEDEVLMRLHAMITSKLSNSNISRNFQTNLMSYEGNLSSFDIESDSIQTNDKVFGSQSSPSKRKDFDWISDPNDISAFDSEVIRKKPKILEIDIDDDEDEEDENCNETQTQSNRSDDYVSPAMRTASSQMKDIQEYLCADDDRSPFSQSSPSDARPSKGSTKSKSSKPLDHKLVRSDYRLQRIDSFFSAHAPNQRNNQENALTNQSLPPDHSMESDDNQSNGNDVTSFIQQQTDSIDDPALSKQQLSMSRDDRELYCSIIDLSTSNQRPSYLKPNHLNGSCSCCVVSRSLHSTDDNPKAESTHNQHRSSPSDETGSPSPTPRCRLVSVQELLQEINNNKHQGLQIILKQHIFVGLIDQDLSLIQYRTKLFLVNHSYLSKHLFYQLVIKQFQSLPRLHLSQPLSVHDLIYSSIQSDRVDDSQIYGWTESLLAHKAVLRDYFSIVIDAQGYLTDMPNIMPIDITQSTTKKSNHMNGYKPHSTALPTFLHRLATMIDWNDEKTCLRSIAEELAVYYSILPTSEAPTAEAGNIADEIDVVSIPKPMNEAADDRDDNVHDDLEELTSKQEIRDRDSSKKRLSSEGFLSETKHIVEDVFYPAFVKYLTPSNQFIDQNAIRQIASLEQLYKVFERC